MELVTKQVEVPKNASELGEAVADLTLVIAEALKSICLVGSTLS